MSTKNKNIKTYDLDSVFDEYMIYLTNYNIKKRESLALEIENLTQEIAEDKQILKDNQEIIAKISALQAEIAKFPVLTDDKRAKLEEDLEKATEKYSSLKIKYEETIKLDTTLFTEAQIKKWEAKTLKEEAAMTKAFEKVETFRDKIEADNQKVELLNAKQQELDKLVTSIIIKEEQLTDIDAIQNFKDLNKEFELKIIEKESSLKEKTAEFNKVSGEPQPSLETFTIFLESNGLSTVHAEEIFKYRHNPERFEKIAYADFKMRKMHPKRDYIIKKVVVPAAITSTAIGATIGAIAGSGLVGGSTVLGFIPVSGTPGLTATATTLTGATIGLASTPIVIKGKNLITRTYYKLKAQNAVKNLNAYENGTNIENLNISKLVAQIQKTQHSILESKGPKNLVLKVINRNRIHQVEAYTKELFEQYNIIDSDKSIDKAIKAKKLKPMYELLSNIDEFIANDIAESKTHAMLTCKENNKNHHHKYMIENVDIYANLKIYIDKLARINAEQDNRQEQLKLAKKTTKNLAQKKEEAYKIVYGNKLITSKLDFDKKYGEFFPVEQGIPLLQEPKKRSSNFASAPECKVVASTLSEDGSILTLELENGKSIKLPANEVQTNKKIATAKEGKNKFSFTYKDGTKQEIIKKAKVLPEVETARSVLTSLLHNNEYVQNLKAEGYKTQTINALKVKLTEWLQNPTQKLVVSGKVKELYNFAIEAISANAKNDFTASI